MLRDATGLQIEFSNVLSRSVRRRGRSRREEGDGWVPDYTIEAIESAPFAQLCYVAWLAGRTDALVVDPGFDTAAVIRVLEEQRLRPAAILNTHGHVDHIAGNAAMKLAFPEAPLIIGRNETALLSDPEANMSAPFGLPVRAPRPIAWWATAIGRGGRVPLPGPRDPRPQPRLGRLHHRAVRSADRLRRRCPLLRVGRPHGLRRRLPAAPLGIRSKLFVLPDATGSTRATGRPPRSGREAEQSVTSATGGSFMPYDVWAISDPHLSFGKPERRDRYAARWRDHAARIEQAWREAVRPETSSSCPATSRWPGITATSSPTSNGSGHCPASRSWLPGTTIAGGTARSPSAGSSAAG